MQPASLADDVSAGTAVDAATQARFDHLSDGLREAERERELAEQQLGRVEAAAIASPPLRPREKPVDSVAIHEARQRVQRLRNNPAGKTICKKSSESDESYSIKCVNCMPVSCCR